MKATEEDKNRGDMLLKVPDLATRIGATPGWVYDAVNYEGMPCCRVYARFWRFLWPTVLDWLQKRR